MKRIINGKKYDTKTAICLAEHDNGFHHSDYNFRCEALFRKKNGELFLWIEGGGFGDHEIEYGDDLTNSDDSIIPLDLENAKKWAEKHCSEEYEDIFGPIEE